MPAIATTLSPRDYDAVLFDLDGVLTRTASVHAAAWKKMFDGFLQARAAPAGEPFVPFDIDTDYPRYVDGKSRYDGVAAFLASRGIELPMGTPEDAADVFCSQIAAQDEADETAIGGCWRIGTVEAGEPGVVVVR